MFTMHFYVEPKFTINIDRLIEICVYLLVIKKNEELV